MVAALAACDDEPAPSSDPDATVREDDAGSTPGQDAGPPIVGRDAAVGPDAWADAGETPPATLFDDMTLSADGPTLVGPDGAAVDFRGAISCCGGAYGWPLFNDDWLDLTADHGVTFLHVRLGPFLTGPEAESDWAAIGGGYPEVGGLADLDAWNDRFWARVRELIELAGERAMWVEVDVADGWAIKHCRWGDLPGYSAWDAAFNVQGEDVCASAASGPIEPGSRHDRWVRKVFEETGRYGNVLYQDGNEVGLVDGYATAWTLSMRDILREVESQNGYVRHLLGTNSGDDATMQADDIGYGELHQRRAPDPGACAGKPCLSNEYNPEPPMTPEEIVDEYCAARGSGTYFWYWRHGQSAEQMVESLSGMQAGCP